MEDKDAVKAFANVMLPMIRRVMPSVIAQDILSVQPMTVTSSRVELRCGTATLAGSQTGTWFTVYVSMPFSFAMKPAHGIEHYQWCVDTFGPEDNVNWFEKDYRFYFRNEADMSMFVLKWTT